MTEIELAIILPAYKIEYLSESLNAVVPQLKNNVRLYVFDDDSPDDIEGLVRTYGAGINFYRFETNLGGSDLAAHWNRCIQKTSEKWIYVYSDDDIIESGSVAEILNSIKIYSKEEIFSLPIRLIDGSGRELSSIFLPPDREYYDSYAVNRLLDKRPLCCASFVFNRTLYKKVGGFSSLKMGWHSDEVTYHRMLINSSLKSAMCINQACVNFRLSKVNISGSKNKQIEKLTALKSAAIYWMKSFENISHDKQLINKWIVRCAAGSGSIIGYRKYKKNFDEIHPKTKIIIHYIHYLVKFAEFRLSFIKRFIYLVLRKNSIVNQRKSDIENSLISD